LFPLMTPWDNKAPDTPQIDGPVRGKPKVEYDFTFSTMDTDGDNVSYYIEWGDGTSTGWTDYFVSGEVVIINHTWNKRNDYTIRCKSKDIYESESDWSAMEVEIPRNRKITNLWFLWFLEGFPNIEIILRIIIL